MADESRSLSKLKESEAKLKETYKKARSKMREMRDGANEANKMASKVPAWALPVGGAVAGYALGYADSMASTPTVRTPVTIAAGGAAWIGSGVASYFGMPTVATLAGATAALAAGIVTHEAGFSKAASKQHAHAA
jgi:hypothetical protein